ncbi:MAG TPA: hypothetical protein VM165_06470, partial [Planctomycetaceae bacterium]|nr:hypothetical protein [Planctomycetaceae bacterium]
MSLAWQEELPLTPVALRSPAAPVVGAAVLGIVLDRLCDAPPSVWWALLAFAILAGLGAVRSPTMSTTVVLLGCGGLFGLWHHAWWAEPLAGDVFHVATDAGLPVVLRGRVVQPSWQHATAGGEPETLAIVECVALLQGEQSTPVAGTVRLQILRTIHPLRAGAVIRVIGR